MNRIRPKKNAAKHPPCDHAKRAAQGYSVAEAGVAV
jgi:hypothetical protein